MNVKVMLHGALATHRRGRVLHEALSTSGTATLPAEPVVVMMFAEEFQTATPEGQSRLIEWTRTAGHVLLLLPPFTAAHCDRPVSWWAERLDSPPRGGECVAKVLAGEVTYRLSGQLQAPPLPGATWGDLSVCVGTYRLHPAAGLFVVTSLPIWSLTILDAPLDVEAWLSALVDFAGEAPAVNTKKPSELDPDHYGFLVFLLSKPFSDEKQAMSGLSASTIFRFSQERARALLRELQERRLVVGAAPTTEAQALVMQSPYAAYMSAVREVSK